MIKVENIEVWGWKHAIRGMRNPMNSWDKSDSKPGCAVGRPEDCNGDCGEWCSGYGWELGSNDLSLMQKLFNGGFAGWADQGNVNPLLRAFLRWCDYLTEEGA